MEDMGKVEFEKTPGGIELFDLKIVEVPPENLKNIGMGMYKDTKDEIVFLEGFDDKFIKFVPVTDRFQPRYIQIVTEKDVDSVVHGMMGVVRKMWDKKTERVVAAKRTSSNWETVDEARLLAKFEHPNIATIYDVAITNPENPKEREVYLITEWLEGKTLDSWMSQPHSLDDVSNVINQISKGIVHINNLGYVYGDLKPLNVMFGSVGNVKIVDMGLSFKLNKDEVAYGFGFSTYLYAPPEQGSEAWVSLKTDVYSLAAILYEILTKSRDTISREFFAKDPERLIPVREEYRDIFNSNPEEHEGLSSTLRKALSKDPSKRHNSVKTLNEELQKVFTKLTKHENETLS